MINTSVLNENNKIENQGREQGSDIVALTRDLCAYASGVVAYENELLFERIRRELPFQLHRYASGSTFNGWTVPQLWRVERAIISRNGQQVFDGRANTLGVAIYSKSFQGELDWEELKPHLVTNADLPDAYVYHCMWQYRPWNADWALCVPYEVYKDLGPGRYHVDLVTSYEPGEMLVGEYEHSGKSDRTIVFNSHTCHPHMANDGFSGGATLIRLMQWLHGQDTFYTYRVVLAPEHLGTVFYLRDRSEEELQRLVCGTFVEMTGTGGPIKATSTFLGNQPLDRALHNVLRHYSQSYEQVPWRKGAGNDETVWEAPGYEVPFVEMTRCWDQFAPFPEYHTSLDTTDRLNEEQVDELFRVLQRTILIFEHNAAVFRQFNGLICLSNPEYDLYLERPDPAVVKNLEEDSEKWGHLLDCLFRYLDGTMTVLDIAEKHDLPFDRLYQYLQRFEKKGLIRFEFAPIERVPISPMDGERENASKEKG